MLIWFVIPAGHSIAQTTEIKPPAFDYVSLNPGNGDVTIHWQPSVTSTVIGYVIQEELISGQNYPIQTVNITSPPYSYSFSYPKVMSEPVHFNIVAIDGLGNESTRTTPSHVTMFSTAEYDSCNAAILVKWTPYVGWSNLKGYNVFQINEDNVLTKYDDVGPGVNSFSVDNVEENKNYCFYVSAIREGGVPFFSNSNEVCITTTTPLAPSYIVGDYTDNSLQNQVNLHFSIDPATVNDSYRLYRAVAASDDYKFLSDLNKAADGSVTYTDAIPSINVYNYKLVYLNRCQAEGSSSIPINNVLLKGKSEAMTNHLSWNSFSSWVNGTGEINVYRTSSLGAREPIAKLTAGETEYADAISAQSQISGDICYQVEVVSNPDPYGKTNVSQSNVFCVNMLGEIFVPNAFTPNNDGQNDIFKPSFTILPSKYSFIIYNRYGFKIFETHNISEGWNGTLSDGTKALEGAYIYFVKMENGAGKELEKRGNFTVIYP